MVQLGLPLIIPDNEIETDKLKDEKYEEHTVPNEEFE